MLCNLIVGNCTCGQNHTEDHILEQEMILLLSARPEPASNGRSTPDNLSDENGLEIKKNGKITPEFIEYLRNVAKLGDEI